MKKLFLLISVLSLFSCERVGYVASVYIQQGGEADTLHVPYRLNQGVQNKLGPEMALTNGVLYIEGRAIAANVSKVSVLDVQQLSTE